jgi:hypothetical protein
VESTSKLPFGDSIRSLARFKPFLVALHAFSHASGGGQCLLMGLWQNPQCFALTKIAEEEAEKIKNKGMKMKKIFEMLVHLACPESPPPLCSEGRGSFIVRD